MINFGFFSSAPCSFLMKLSFANPAVTDELLCYISPEECDCLSALTSSLSLRLCLRCISRRWNRLLSSSPAALQLCVCFSMLLLLCLTVTNPPSLFTSSMWISWRRELLPRGQRKLENYMSGLSMTACLWSDAHVSLQLWHFSSWGVLENKHLLKLSQFDLSESMHANCHFLHVKNKITICDRNYILNIYFLIKWLNLSY